jgi:hypothetical protein
VAQDAPASSQYAHGAFADTAHPAKQEAVGLVVEAEGCLANGVRP